MLELGPSRSALCKKVGVPEFFPPLPYFFEPPPYFLSPPIKKKNPSRGVHPRSDGTKIRGDCKKVSGILSWGKVLLKPRSSVKKRSSTVVVNVVPLLSDCYPTSLVSAVNHRHACKGYRSLNPYLGGVVKQQREAS